MTKWISLLASSLLLAACSHGQATSPNQAQTAQPPPQEQTQEQPTPVAPEQTPPTTQPETPPMDGGSTTNPPR